MIVGTMGPPAATTGSAVVLIGTATLRRRAAAASTATATATASSSSSSSPTIRRLRVGRGGRRRRPEPVGGEDGVGAPPLMMRRRVAGSLSTLSGADCGSGGGLRRGEGVGCSHHSPRRGRSLVPSDGGAMATGQHAPFSSSFSSSSRHPPLHVAGLLPLPWVGGGGGGGGGMLTSAVPPAIKRGAALFSTTTKSIEEDGSNAASATGNPDGENDRDADAGKSASASAARRKRNRADLSPCELQQLYELFGLSSFSDDEIRHFADSVVLSPLEPLHDPHPENVDGDGAGVAASASSSSSHPPLSGSMLGSLSDDYSSGMIPPASAGDVVTRENLSRLMQIRILRLMREEDDASAAAHSDAKSNEDDDGGMTQVLLEEKVRTYSDRQAGRFLLHLARALHVPDEEERSHRRGPCHVVLTKREFVTAIRDEATNVDFRRVLPISLSMLLVGSSVGIIVPLMPFVVERLGMTPGEYGTVVSSFALAKLFFNVPSAILVERHGRKPYLVYSLLLCSVGVGGIGLATSLDHLVACRLVTGVAVSALSTAASLTIADISTPRNRATTMAPMNSGFSAGMALGPAFGGLLGDHLGVTNTFLAVGGSYFGMAAFNQLVLVETKRDAAHPFPWLEEDVSGGAANDGGGDASKAAAAAAATSHMAMASNPAPTPSVSHAVRDAVGQWVPLWSDGRVRSVVIINGFYWIALAGAQMTLLPLKLADPAGLAMTASGVGKVYMGMSLVQVLGNPSVARVIDRVGRVPSIVTGCAILSSSMMALPFCGGVHELAVTLGCWSLGSTILATAPFAYVTDTVSVDKRAQSIALLRTAGDVGFLVGAVGTGALADWTGSMDSAIHGCSGVLLTATGWFATRHFMARRGGTIK